MFYYTVLIITTVILLYDTPTCYDGYIKLKNTYSASFAGVCLS